MNEKNPRLVSLIIPVYKQEKTIEKDLTRIKDVMDQMRYPYEIIVVVDGELDNTEKNAKKVKAPNILVTGYPHNHGKGHAVRFGMARSKGDIVAFIDAGMDINPNGLSMLLEHFEWYNADIIVGSKLHPVSKVQYPITRKILSWGYRFLVRVLFGLSIRDTQVGMKFFRRKVLEDVSPRLLVKTYAFDIEILAVSNYLGYNRIFEAPVELDFSGVSSITQKGFWNTIFHMLWDTMAVFYRLRILHYYDDKNNRKWKYDPELNFKVNLP
ncbi:MAG TPA: glycosyltransferase [Candidatus Saccharimonadales bacterium]|nr:glycosyltransferase [Candidatus Saccharimonadales bacterium]